MQLNGELREIAISKILPGVEATALVDIALARVFSQHGQILTVVVIVTVLNAPDRRVAVTALAARRALRTRSVLLVHLASVDIVYENRSVTVSSRLPCHLHFPTRLCARAIYLTACIYLQSALRTASSLAILLASPENRS